MVNQLFCYILIIPGFGIISHVIGTMSDKSVFGQCGPKNNWIYYFLKRTICRKLINIIMLLAIQNTINVSNYINSFKVKIFVFINNPQITNARVKNILKFKIINFFKLSMLVGISEAIRLLLIYLLKHIFTYYKNNFYLINSVKCSAIIPLELLDFNQSDKTDPFNEWLAGIIDGDGCFLLSKKGYASLEITIQLRDVRCLNLIKQKFGGGIKVRANQNHLRYRLHNKKGLIQLINSVNGLIRNPIRFLQLAKICDNYEIPIYQVKPLIYHDGWLSGFFDTDGSVYLNLTSDQMFITLGQKNKLMLDSLVPLYGGRVYLSKGKEQFKWIVYRKSEILNLLNYFNIYKPRSQKYARLQLINKYYELRSLKAHKASVDSVLGKAWKQFLIKWNSFDN